MTERAEERTEQGKSAGKEIKREEIANPIPEPSYSVDVKRTGTEAIDEAQKPRRFRFKIQPHIVTSDQIQIARRKPDIGEDLMISPVSIDADKVGVPEEIDLEIEAPEPRFRIWESAQIRPVTPLHDSFESVEIGLPPRNLMQVETQKEDRENPKTEPETSNEIVSETKKDERDIAKENAQSVESSHEDSGEAESRAPPDIYDVLFQMPEGSIAIEEPLCIVAETRDSERYQQTLETLCREQFRQYVGGRPLADLLSSGEADSVEATRVQNRIVSYDDSDSDFFEFVNRLDGEEGITRELIEEEGEADLERLHARLDEFFTQSLGYLLLIVDEQFAGALYEHLNSKKDIRESINIRPLQARSLPDDLKRELVRLAWGNVYLDTNQRDLDTLFHSGEAEFKEEIEPKHGAIEEITRHEPGEESRLHYLLKCFVVEVILRKENLEPSGDHSWKKMRERVRTESQPWASSEIRPDVFNSRTREVFEIETLYQSDHRKINRTVAKYEGVNVKRINVVLPNLTCLRNLQTIYRKTNEKFGDMFQNEVSFWTLDANSRELLPIETVVERVGEISERTQDPHMTNSE
jgi:hypothetical protein